MFTNITRFIVVSVCSALAVANAYAQDLTTNGMAAFSSLRTTYYIGALQLSASTANADAILSSASPQAMRIKVRNDWSPRRFSSLWSDAIFLNSSDDELNVQTDNINDFLELPKGYLLPGDEILIEFDGTESRVSLNDIAILEVKGKAFFNTLLRTWIGNKPPSRGFKDGLLKAKFKKSVAEDFASLEAAEERKYVVESWYPSAGEEVTEQVEQAIAVLTPAQPTQVAASAKAEAPVAKPVKPQAAPKAPVTVAKAPEPKAPAPAPAKPAAPVKAMAKAVDPAVHNGHLDAIEAAVKSVAKYPSRSEQARELEGLVSQMNPEGTVVFQIQINRAGELVDIQEKQISDIDLLNKMSLRALRNAEFPQAPDSLQGKLFSRTVSLEFINNKVK